MRSFFSCTAALLIAIGCSDDETKLWLIVDSDLGVPAELARVDFEVRYESDIQTKLVDLTKADAPQLPLVQPVLAKGNAFEAITVVIEGRGSNEALRVSRRTKIRF